MSAWSRLNLMGEDLGLNVAGYCIYKCSLGCRTQAHFHCFCEKLLLNRNQFTHHLSTKHQFLSTADLSVRPGVIGADADADADAAEPTPTPSPSSGQQPNADPSPTRSPISGAQGSCNATTWTSDTFSNALVSPETLSNEVASASSDEPCQSENGPKKLAACQQGNTVLNKRCHHMHMKTKHSSRAAAVTSSSPLKAVELEILSQLRVLQQQQSLILQLLLKHTNTDGINHPTAADLRAMFPVTDEEGLATLDLKLSEAPDLKNRLISFFGNEDGLPIPQTVERIKGRILSNTFAKRMDWRGKNNKMSFASSCLKEIVINAVRRNSLCARAADEAVESAVRKWLQQAGGRDEGAEERGDGREVSPRMSLNTEQ